MSENEEKGTTKLSMVRVTAAIATVELGVALLTFLAYTFFAKETGFQFEIKTYVTFTTSMVLGFSGFLLLALVTIFNEKGKKTSDRENRLDPIKVVKFSMPDTALFIGLFQMITALFAFILLVSKPPYETTIMEEYMLLTTIWSSLFSGCITMLLGSFFIGEKNKEEA